MKKFVVVALLVTGFMAVGGCGNATTVGLPGPTVSNLTPTLGPIIGGDLLTLTGTNFTPDTTLTLGGLAVSGMTIVDEQTITFLSPPAVGGTNAGVVLTNAQGTAILLSAYFYIPPPKIHGIDPNTGDPVGGDTVTISGSGFIDYGAGANTVMFGTTPAASVITVNDSTISCVSPASASLGTVPVSVANANGTAVRTNGFSYFPPPTVGSITPDVGSPLGGAFVTVTGSGFVVNSPGPSTVTVGGIACTNVNVVDDFTLECFVPAGVPGPRDVVVQNSNGVGNLPGAFSYYPYPTLSLVNPPTGTESGGTAVIITGTGFVDNFAGANAVTFGGVSASSVSVLNDTTITCVTPPGIVGAATVSVLNGNGQGDLPAGFTFELVALLGSDGTNLYKVDETSAQTQAVGAHGASVIAMATHPDGTIYAITTGAIYKLSLSNGSLTHVASLSIAMNGITDMFFKSTTLYAANYIGQTYLINHANGSVTTKQQCPYYYAGQRKSGFAWDGTTWGIMTYDGYYCFYFDPEVGGYPSYTSALPLHAVRTIGLFNGTLYGADCQAGSGGSSMTLVKWNSGLTSNSTATIGGLPAGFIALTGTN